MIVEGKKFICDANGNKIYDVLKVYKKWDGTIDRSYEKCTLEDIYKFEQCIAIDGDFVNSDDFKLIPKIKIFARILPDKKAYIVKLIK